MSHHKNDDESWIGGYVFNLLQGFILWEDNDMSLFGFGRKNEARVKILGGGCAKCNQLEAATVEALTELGMDTTIDHVKDYEKIANKTKGKYR